MMSELTMFGEKDFTEEFNGYFIAKMEDLYGRIEACEENGYPVKLVVELYKELEGVLKGIRFLAGYITTENDLLEMKRALKEWEMYLDGAWQYVASRKWTEELGQKVEIREERAGRKDITYIVTFGENRYRMVGKDQVTRLLSDLKH